MILMKIILISQQIFPRITHLYVKNYTEQCLKKFKIQEQRDMILFVLLVNMRNNSHHILMMLAVVMWKLYHHIRQQKH